MGLFSNQFANVVEWEEWKEDMIFWKWTNREIKKGSKLIIRPGQDAIFLHNGKMEGVFHDEGEYDIESQIIPFLSTLKGFKFGFNSGMRAEVLFINTKEFLVKWGTKGPINIPAQGFPGGMPIRANGTFTFKVGDYVTLIDKIAGIKQQYHVEDIKQRITAVLDQLLMKWISQKGKDMFNLQANSYEISEGIKDDLNMQIVNDGLTITGFNIMSFNYPEQVQKMIEKVAAQGMIGNMNTYQQVSMTDGISSGTVQGGGVASDMTGMMMGMQMANQMMQNMNNMGSGVNNAGANAAVNGAPNAGEASQAAGGTAPKFCPNCGQATTGSKFCPNCGQQLL